MGERVAGRWRRHEAAVRSEKVTVRLTPAQRVRHEAAARRRGLRLGGYLAEAGDFFADLPEADDPPATPAVPVVSVDRELLAALAQTNRLLRQYGNNVNQAVALWHATGQAPVWLPDAIRLASGVARRIDPLVDALGDELRRRRS